MLKPTLKGKNGGELYTFAAGLWRDALCGLQLTCLAQAPCTRAVCTTYQTEILACKGALLERFSAVGGCLSVRSVGMIQSSFGPYLGHP
jgi:hypothetical protein